MPNKNPYSNDKLAELSDIFWKAFKQENLFLKNTGQTSQLQQATTQAHQQ